MNKSICILLLMISLFSCRKENKLLEIYNISKDEIITIDGKMSFIFQKEIYLPIRNEFFIENYVFYENNIFGPYSSCSYDERKKIFVCEKFGEFFIINANREYGPYLSIEYVCKNELTNDCYWAVFENSFTQGAYYIYKNGTKINRLNNSKIDFSYASKDLPIMAFSQGNMLVYNGQIENKKKIFWGDKYSVFYKDTLCIGENIIFDDDFSKILAIMYQDLYGKWFILTDNKMFGPYQNKPCIYEKENFVYWLVKIQKDSSSSFWTLNTLYNSYIIQYIDFSTEISESWDLIQTFKINEILDVCFSSNKEKWACVAKIENQFCVITGYDFSKKYEKIEKLFYDKNNKLNYEYWINGEKFSFTEK